MSSTRGPDNLDFPRDIPTSKDDVEFLRRDGVSGGDNLLIRLDRLTLAVESLGLRPGRETMKGWKPFELDEVD